MAKVKVSKAAKVTQKSKAPVKAQTKIKLASAPQGTGAPKQKRLDTNEAAAFLGCSVPLIYAMLRDGRIASNKKETVGSRIFIQVDELQRLMDSNIVQPRKKPNQIPSPEAAMRNKNQVASFSVSAPASDVAYLSTILASQGLSISDWVAKMITHTVNVEKESTAQRLNMVSGS